MGMVEGMMQDLIGLSKMERIVMVIQTRLMRDVKNIIHNWKNIKIVLMTRLSQPGLIVSSVYNSNAMAEIRHLIQ